MIIRFSSWGNGGRGFSSWIFCEINFYFINIKIKNFPSSPFGDNIRNDILILESYIWRDASQTLRIFPYFSSISFKTFLCVFCLMMMMMMMRHLSLLSIKVQWSTYHKGTSPMSADDFADDVHLVTGGAGFTGFKLGQKLADIGKKVILVDIVPPKWPLASNMTFVQVFKIYLRARYFYYRIKILISKIAQSAKAAMYRELSFDHDWLEN